ncbi:MAG: hypothetical protein WC366_02580 [Bacilli bacterium]
MKKSKKLKYFVKRRSTIVETPDFISHATKRVIFKISRKIEKIIIQSLFTTTEINAIFVIYKTIRIIVATKKVIVSLEGFVKNISHTREFFTYSEDGHYEILDDLKSFLITLQSGKEFVDNMKKLCQTIGLKYEPFKKS